MSFIQRNLHILALTIVSIVIFSFYTHGMSIATVTELFSSGFVAITRGFEAITQVSRTEEIEATIRAGTGASAIDDRGDAIFTDVHLRHPEFIALIEAISTLDGSGEVVSLLLDAVNINAKDNDGQRAIDIAVNFLSLRGTEALRMLEEASRE